jgi:hypothetical protein
MNDIVNDQRFIDINIDSDNEECSSSSASPSSPNSTNNKAASTTNNTASDVNENNRNKFLFNFNKTKGLNQSPITSNDINQQVNNNSINSNKYTKTSSLFLQNMKNEISLNVDFEYSDDDEDDDDDTFDSHINNQSRISFNHDSFLNNLLSSTQQTIDDSKLDSDHSSNNSIPSTPSYANKNSDSHPNDFKISAKQKSLNEYANSELTKSIVSSTSSMSSK